MRKLNLIALMTMMFAIALLSVGQSPSIAEQFGGKQISGPIIGKPIHSEHGVVLGKVENIVLNDSGCAQYVILHGEFEGAQAKLYPIPWTYVARTTPDAFFVDLEPTFLVNAPSFERGRIPEFRQWEARVHTFYRSKAGNVTGKHGRAGETPGAFHGDKGKMQKGADTQEQMKKGAGTHHEQMKKGEGTHEQMKKGAGKQNEQWKQPATGGTEKSRGDKQERQVTPQSHQKKSSPTGSREMRERGSSDTKEHGQSQMMKQGSSNIMNQGRSQSESGRFGGTENQTPGKAGSGLGGKTDSEQRGQDVK